MCAQCPGNAPGTSVFFAFTCLGGCVLTWPRVALSHAVDNSLELLEPELSELPDEDVTESFDLLERLLLLFPFIANFLVSVWDPVQLL